MMPCLYLDLLKRCVTNVIYCDPALPERPGAAAVFDLAARSAGRDSPSQAHTMIGLRRLDNIQAAVESVLRDAVPGDLIEAGVGRGGAAVFMRGVLRAYGVTDRKVFVADSFGQFPRSSAAGVTARSYTSPYWQEMAEVAARHPEHLAEVVTNAARGTSLAEVRDTFDRYGLLDEQVRFLPGWFVDTLQTPEIEQLALLRVDGDLYDSTIEVLRRLYPKVAAGGYVVIDDYHFFPECREAVEDYLASLAERPVVDDVDEAAVWWRKPLEPVAAPGPGATTKER
jgi:hypothetical protein